MLKALVFLLHSDDGLYSYDRQLETYYITANDLLYRTRPRLSIHISARHNGDDQECIEVLV